MTRVLITVSGVIPDGLEAEIEAGHRPRVDYLEIARACGGDVIDVTVARTQSGRLGRVIERVGGRASLLAWASFRRRGAYDVVLTDGEHVGFPLALLLVLRRGDRPRHAMIAHLLTPRRKTFLYRCLRLHGAIDLMIVYASRQRDFIVDELGFPAAGVVLSTFMVDTAFWTMADDRPQPTSPPMICATGREFRDYPTLIEAVRGMDVRVVITLGSLWSSRDDSSRQVELPPNVEVSERRLSYPELRDVYAASGCVVVPLYDVEFQAGITSILEGMAMGKPIVCSRASGQTDAVVDGESGTYVPPGDVAAMRAAIQEMLADPERAAAMGSRGRAAVAPSVDVAAYAERLAAHLSELSGSGPSRRDR